MAATQPSLTLRLRFPFIIKPSLSPHSHKSAPFCRLRNRALFPAILPQFAFRGGRRRSRYVLQITNAIEEGQEEKLNSSSSTVENESSKEEEAGAVMEGSSGADVKEGVFKGMVAREGEQSSGELWKGVAEEIREIEWPAFGKVVGTTWVVLGVIAGSSVVLLTVNAVLAELSDRVFAGRGVQDFFG